MEKFVVLNDSGITLEGSDTVHAKGEVLELDVANEQTVRYVEGNFIAPVTEYSDDQLEDFVVTEEFLTDNPLLASEGGIKVGDTIRVPKEVEEDEPVIGIDVATEGADTTVETETVPVMTHAGKAVIRSGTRIVNGVEVNEVTLEDGSTLDLTDEEYDRMVESAK